MSGGAAFGQDLQFAGKAIWQVLLASVVLGAGLPVVFALGVRSLAWGTGHDAGDGAAARPGNPLGKVLAVVLFAIVLYVLAIGIYYIVVGGHGKELQFNGIWPSQVAKS
jgi:hypothetical protein